MRKRSKKKSESEKEPIGTCRNTCIFFPQEPNTIFEEYYDDFGIKHRKVERRCGYDGSLINSWGKQCPWDIERRQKKEEEEKEIKKS